MICLPSASSCRPWFLPSGQGWPWMQPGSEQPTGASVSHVAQPRRAGEGQPPGEPLVPARSGTNLGTECVHRCQRPSDGLAVCRVLSPGWLEKPHVPSVVRGPLRLHAASLRCCALTPVWEGPSEHMCLLLGLCVRVSDRTVRNVQETTAVTATLKGSLDTYCRGTRNWLTAEGFIPHASVCIPPKSSEVACNIVQGFTAHGKDVLEGKGDKCLCRREVAFGDPGGSRRDVFQLSWVPVWPLSAQSPPPWQQTLDGVPGQGALHSVGRGGFPPLRSSQSEGAQGPACSFHPQPPSGTSTNFHPQPPSPLLALLGLGAACTLNGPGLCPGNSSLRELPPLWIMAAGNQAVPQV
ncbi:uncharacterized protein LOC129022630 isoform X1 [Pongo pygmaeus]|uniref:uncharacterized protein LOC129022630 isoform X1 n=1 Tax=Pongo pygmaeus TaxID=9600 RepID=UPI00300C91F6